MITTEDLKVITDRLERDWGRGGYRPIIRNVFTTESGVCAFYDCLDQDNDLKLAAQRLSFFVREKDGVLREKTSIIV